MKIVKEYLGLILLILVIVLGLKAMQINATHIDRIEAIKTQVNK